MTRSAAKLMKEEYRSPFGIHETFNDQSPAMKGRSVMAGMAGLWAAAVNPTVVLPYLQIFGAGLLLAWLRPPTGQLVQTT
ncbi:hypothetical protein QO034_14185 [Sedimentitalea sp. JM2-8]|uniref:Uncharacterized protein n=1 Tax=Sedimentitalea xiamensis TaxID=3050037 RepID=A0ABT7FGQ6_9RHOB|nr:hypothetical protein [Sedimentitalea xiamensis]MDK3074263.1 hypothetical protein [Sedimentitalea xiamensis]